MRYWLSISALLLGGITTGASASDFGNLQQLARQQARDPASSAYLQTLAPRLQQEQARLKKACGSGQGAVTVALSIEAGGDAFVVGSSSEGSALTLCLAEHLAGSSFPEPPQAPLLTLFTYP